MNGSGVSNAARGPGNETILSVKTRAPVDYHDGDRRRWSLFAVVGDQERPAETANSVSKCCRKDVDRNSGNTP